MMNDGGSEAQKDNRMSLVGWLIVLVIVVIFTKLLGIVIHKCMADSKQVESMLGQEQSSLESDIGLRLVARDVSIMQDTKGDRCFAVVYEPYQGKKWVGQVMTITIDAKRVVEHPLAQAEQNTSGVSTEERGSVELEQESQ